MNFIYITEELQMFLLCDVSPFEVTRHKMCENDPKQCENDVK